jgi:hypothetical protein
MKSRRASAQRLRNCPASSLNAVGVIVAPLPSEFYHDSRVLLSTDFSPLPDTVVVEAASRFGACVRHSIDGCSDISLCKDLKNLVGLIRAWKDSGRSTAAARCVNICRALRN